MCPGNKILLFLILQPCQVKAKRAKGLQLQPPQRKGPENLTEGHNHRQQALPYQWSPQVTLTQSDKPDKDSMASVMDLLLNIHSRLDAQQKEMDELKATRERVPGWTSTSSAN